MAELIREIILTKINKSDLSYHPVTPDRWKDFELLFGKRGACGGCWCMNWRLMKAQFEFQKGDQNKKAMKSRIKKGSVPGVIACYNSDPIGWCSIEPRENFPRLALARTLKPIDDKPVWSISCLFIAKDYRKQNIAAALVKASVKYAKSQNANIVEAYPYDLTGKDEQLPDPFVWTGLVQIFIEAGFKEAARFSKTRPIMRKNI